MEYDIMPGRSSENAKKAIALAVKRGFAAEDVRTFRDGYQVPLDAPDEKTKDEGQSGKDESKAEDDKKPATKTARKRATTKKE